MSKHMKQCAVIEVLTAKKLPPIDIHWQMKVVYEQQCPDTSTVQHLAAHTDDGKLE
jgi:hypothetical protein